MGNYIFNNNKKDATAFTARINREFAEKLGIDLELGSNEEYDRARANCIYPVDDIRIVDENGNEVWNLEKYSFLKQGKVPSTVNPSLWINGRSNYQAGVFEVLQDKIYQVRGLDISNLTIIKSDNGWIVQDVMSNKETASAAIDLLEKALKTDVRNKVTAVIISHTHADHFGGIKGVIDDNSNVPIYVPAGFDLDCVRENVFAGTACGRRSIYQFGQGIEAGERGHVSTGLGFYIPKGAVTFIKPTNYIDRNQTVVIDGITVEFQLTPGTEAPAEMNNYFADYRALWVAENCNGTLHNLYPIRGAQLRDSSAWADYILEAVDKFAHRSDVIFQSHNWPHYNDEENPDAIKNYLINNAAVYKYIHDQTLLYANKGYTAKAIARKLEIPEILKDKWYIRPYYGSVQINSRAVYTKYLGFYNGNPNNIDPLTELENAKVFVEYAGGEEAVLHRALADFEAGDYRKAAYSAGQVVYVNEANEKAKQLLADSFEQLGYVAESGIWRNAYLQGAQELRNGVSDEFINSKNKENELVKCMDAELILKYIGILIDYDINTEDDRDFEFDLEITDEHQFFRVRRRGGILLTNRIETVENEKYARLPKIALLAIVGKQLEAVKSLIDTNVPEYLCILNDSVQELDSTSDFPLVTAHEFH